MAFPYKWVVLAHASDFPKFSHTSSIWLQQEPIPLAKLPQAWRYLTATSLASQSGFAWPPPSPAQVAAICRALRSLYQVALGGTGVAADLGLHLPGGPRASTPAAELQMTLKHHSTTSTSSTLKGGTQQYQSPTVISPSLWGGLLQSWSFTVLHGCSMVLQPISL